MANSVAKEHSSVATLATLSVSPTAVFFSHTPGQANAATNRSAEELLPTRHAFMA